jgi:hypothetical protein
LTCEGHNLGKPVRLYCIYLSPSLSWQFSAPANICN